MTDAWVTPEECAQSWPDVVDLPDNHVARLLAAATRACSAFAPALADPDTIPADYKLAVCYQARELHLAGKRTGDSAVVGDAAYPIRVRPLTDTVKQLLRPQQGNPGIG